MTAWAATHSGSVKPRTAGGFRYYTEETMARLLLTRNAIRFGFTSRELAGFLRARDRGHAPCHAVRAAGYRLLQEMDEHLARLKDARTALADTVAAWDARLERTPSGTAAHLLTLILAAPVPPHRRVTRMRKGPK